MREGEPGELCAGASSAMGAAEGEVTGERIRAQGERDKAEREDAAAMVDEDSVWPSDAGRDGADAAKLGDSEQRGR
jgi:hypothetical protein